MHQASLHGENIHDSASFGWSSTRDSGTFVFKEHFLIITFFNIYPSKIFEILKDKSVLRHVLPLQFRHDYDKLQLLKEKKIMWLYCNGEYKLQIYFYFSSSALVGTNGRERRKLHQISQLWIQKGTQQEKSKVL